MIIIVSFFKELARETTERNFNAVKVAWTLVKNNLSEYSMIF